MNPDIAANLDRIIVMGGALRVVTEGIAIGQTNGVPHKQVCIDVESQKLLDLYERTICTT
jgi:hypothetical protein